MGSAAAGVRAGPDLGRGAVPGPAVRGPAEHQGHAGGWEHTFYHLLEEGEHDAPDNHSIQSIHETIPRMTVDGKAMCEVNDTRVLSVKAAEVGRRPIKNSEIIEC